MIQAQVIADSKNEFGNRIVTMKVVMPRILLAEFNTHRMFSRNSASSRAIPFEKMVKAVEEYPFIPLAWQKDHKGMQGTEYFDDEHKEVLFRRGEWLRAKESAINHAIRLNTQSVTKQLCNRLLEPFMWHTVIVTATEWENFFELRCPRYDIKVDEIGGHSKYHIFRSKKEALEHRYQDVWLPNEDNAIEWLKLNKGQAEIHMMALAEAMWDAYNESTPKELKAGEWHVPFGNTFDIVNGVDEKGNDTEYKGADPILLKIKIATARCAQVSYTIVGEEKETTSEKLIALHDRLAKSGHWSPFEHCAKSMNYDEMYNQCDSQDLGHCSWSGNFKGFVQYRKTFKGENKV